VIFFLRELVMSNLRVARDVIAWKRDSRPGIIALPLDLHSDLEITLLATFIALTPGTIPMDVSHDRKTMYIHAMFVTDPELLRQSLKQGLERRIMELLR
jgi:multicomponent Na+:H+ antiporter subunit E